jgi:hypothetical protein
MKRILSYIILLLLLISVQQAAAQRRAEIDQAREGLWYFDKEALVKSKEFIRKDSSYYVGYMYEGAYKYFRAADLHGYKNAIAPLNKALKLFLRDYGKKLKAKSSNLMAYAEAYRYHQDYSMIVSLLEESYRNIERPDMALNILQDMARRNIQKDFYADPYNTIAWIYHRSRMHTSDKYSFLGSSIEENDRIALTYLDSAVLKYKKHYYLNSQIFPREFVEDDLYRVYHYKSLIYSYLMETDSAELYYQKLKAKSYFPNNNYATFRLTLGDIPTAEEYYKKAQDHDYTDKRIRESNYMLSLINIYQGQPEKGTSMLKEMIRAQGSTPGFGWHNIALSRTHFYNGLVEESDNAAFKASKFHELHIGTTWGQEQYDMGVTLLNYMNQDRQIKSVKFENRGWWYSISDLLSLPGKILKRWTTGFVLANQFATNPERENVTYRLFSSESITSFDEIWFLLKDFSPDFFIKKYEQFINDDKRPRVKKYFRFFLAKFLAGEGETSKAIDVLNEIIADPTLDTDNEKLLIARVYETLAQIYDDMDNEAERDRFIMMFYHTYPQLVPYSGLQMKFGLDVQGADDETAKEIIEELKDCNISFEANAAWPKVIVEFRKNEKNLREVFYTVASPDGNIMVQPSAFIFNDSEGNGKKLAYRIFNIPKK